MRTRQELKEDGRINRQLLYRQDVRQKRSSKSFAIASGGCSCAKKFYVLRSGRLTLPPTPKLQKAAKQPIAAKLGLLAAIIPKTAVMPRVRLNAHLRPNTSHPNPQNMAPKSKPMFCASVRSGGRVGLNSLVMGVNIREVTMGQRLSEAHPNPTTIKSCH